MAILPSARPGLRCKAEERKSQVWTFLCLSVSSRANITVCDRDFSRPNTKKTRFRSIPFHPIKEGFHPPKATKSCHRLSLDFPQQT